MTDFYKNDQLQMTNKRTVKIQQRRDNATLLSVWRDYLRNFGEMSRGESPL